MTVFGHLWSTPETDELFGDDGRTRIWLAVLGAVAAEQGDIGLIPPDAAAAIAERAEQAVDLEAVGRTRRTGHWTLGLIWVLQRDLDESARQWGVVRRHGAGRRRHLDRPRGAAVLIASRDLAAVETSTRGARGPPSRRRHARPHARPAGAADHVRLQGVGVDRRDPAPPCPHRIGAAAARGRPAGGRGRDALRLGSAGPELQRRVLSRLGLGVPDISWLTARDRVAELVGCSR